ncbi:hypothetical protein BDI4_1560005 [Burkholderia diffusa]|nr:hypothetical protein BDI4_1560005 [Burkholderia diffusa]
MCVHDSRPRTRVPATIHMMFDGPTNASGPPIRLMFPAAMPRPSIRLAPVCPPVRRRAATDDGNARTRRAPGAPR